MKKLLNCFTVFISAVLLLTFTSISFSAATIFTVDGYSFSINDDEMLSLCGWDNRTSDFVVPDRIAERYVNDIAMYGFQNNNKITSVDFSQASRLNRISTYAFENCTSLDGTLYLPPGIVFLGDAAFMNCTSITELDYKAKTASIPEQCFRNCSSLKKVSIEAGPTSIDINAFRDCTSLESVYIPKTVTSISPSAFRNTGDFIIECYKDSYALQFAEENEIDHIVLDGDKIGDVNGDGVVDILDATEIQKYAAESTDFTDEQFELGDINKDGYCDVIDALLVQKSVIGAYELPQNIIRY